MEREIEPSNSSISSLTDSTVHLILQYSTVYIYSLTYLVTKGRRTPRYSYLSYQWAMSSPFHHTLSATNVIMRQIPGGLNCRLQQQKVVLASQNSYSLPSPETVPLRFSRFRFLSELLIHEQKGFQHSCKKCTDWALFDTALSLNNQSVSMSKYDD